MAKRASTVWHDHHRGLMLNRGVARVQRHQPRCLHGPAHAAGHGWRHSGGAVQGESVPALCGPARGRAEETLRVLGDMAALGQVIDLTHHEHLAEIARQTVPDVRVLPL